MFEIRRKGSLRPLAPLATTMSNLAYFLAKGERNLPTNLAYQSQ